jgi:hypothetical protein
VLHHHGEAVQTSSENHLRLTQKFHKIFVLEFYPFILINLH